jgi:ATP-dependent Clp protease ATP-binding subunit ClpC
MIKYQTTKFLVCPDCGGHGFVAGKKCLKCRGLGVVAPFTDKFLFFGKKIDRLNIACDRGLRVFNKIFNWLLASIGLFGFFVIGYVNFPFEFRPLITPEYWLTPSWDKTIFWFTVLVDLYLYYRLQEERSPAHQVLLRRSSAKNDSTQNFHWPEILKFKKQMIDAAPAFELEAIDFIEAAWSLASDLRSPVVTRLHFLAVLPQFNQGALIAGRLGMDLEKFKTKIGRALTKKIEVGAPDTDWPQNIHELLLLAYLNAYDAGRRQVSLIDVVLATIETAATEKNGDLVETVLIEMDLNYEKLANVVEWLRIQKNLRENLSHFRARARYRSRSGMDRAMTAVATPLLNQFSVDLTEQARLGGLFPCIGRDKEWEKIFRVFESGRQGAILIGRRGVGKTAMLEGLAQKMVEESAPEILRDKRLVSLNIPALLAGADPALAEERLLQIAAEVAHARNIVLAIEDIHALTGITAGSESSLDLSSVLADLLKRGLFLALATTTPEEYRRAIESKNLAGVFDPIKIEEMSANEAIQVLEGKSGPIEYQNNVFFSYDSLDQAVELSSKYLPEQTLPDKAINLLLEVAAKVRAARGERSIVSGNDVAEVIAAETGIQTAKITVAETDKLLHLEEEIHARVVGQDEAVKMVAASLRRARAELRDAKRPIASLLFLGPTGVGKTELAKTVAAVYFGREENMLRFDMSEYQDSASAARLIGEGEKAGLLTEAVRKKPFALLLFDEVEKAHPDILNLFLQMLDDGRLTDASGRMVDFTNTIIVMTSNAGAAVIQDELNKNTSIEKIKELLLNEELRKNFRPEFLNRFDGLIVFKPLTMVEVIAIARILLAKIIKQLEEKNINLTITDGAVAELAELGFDARFGARPLRRVIQERIDNLLADYLLQGKIDKRDKITIDVGGKITVEKAEVL